MFRKFHYLSWVCLEIFHADLRQDFSCRSSSLWFWAVHSFGIEKATPKQTFGRFEIFMIVHLTQSRACWSNQQCSVCESRRFFKVALIWILGEISIKSWNNEASYVSIVWQNEHKLYQNSFVSCVKIVDSSLSENRCLFSLNWRFSP